MKLRQLIDRYRADTLDLKKPYFCSDEELTFFANQAEAEACRRALLIVDSTSKVAQIDLSAGDEGVALDDSIIYVRRGRLASRGKALVFRVAAAMDEEVPGWEDAAASVPLVAVPDWQTQYLRLWPPCKTADTLKMTVVRTPLDEMEADDDEPEIASRYHPFLLHWIKHLAYSKQDSDLYDPARAKDFADKFANEFGQPRAAIDEHWAAEQYYDIGDH